MLIPVSDRLSRILLVAQNCPYSRKTPDTPSFTGGNTFISQVKGDLANTHTPFCHRKNALNHSSLCPGSTFFVIENLTPYCNGGIIVEVGAMAFVPLVAIRGLPLSQHVFFDFH